MNEYNYKVLINIIGAVETGGQVYGKQRYDAYAGAYTNSPKEYTCTLGAFQFYGYEAMDLIKMIRDADPDNFKRIDSNSMIATKIGSDWVATKWNPTSSQKDILIKLISSDVGKECQDKLVKIRIDKYLNKAYEYGIKPTETKVLMAWSEIEHLGGLNPTKRIFDRIAKPYTLDKVMESLSKDKLDTSSSNQVGDNIYWSRHQKCYEFINKYAIEEDASVSNPAPEVTPKPEVSSMDFSKYYGKISNSGSDERGKYKGGSAGDQTGTEWQIRSWYNRPWTHVIRHPDVKVREKIAEYAISAANNNNIGYDQDQRYTFWDALKTSGYNPANIKTKVESDCSAGVCGIVKAVGYTLGIDALKKVSSDCYSGNIRPALKNAGFTVLTDSKYLTGYDYLLPGDILLYEYHHVATNLGVGKHTAGASTPSTPTPTPAPSPSTKGYLTKGDVGEEVKELQKNLNLVMKSGLKVDGDLGDLTYKAIIAFQDRYGLETDGKYGALSKAKMVEVMTPKWVGEATTTVNVRTGPAKTFSNLPEWKFLNETNLVDICDEVDGWYFIRIAGKYFGYVKADYIKKK